MSNISHCHVYNSFLLCALICIFRCVDETWSLSSSRPLSYPKRQAEIKYVYDRRCLFCPARSKDAQFIPLILIGGMAQTISSWEHLASPFSRNRDVMVYESLGQGPYPQSFDSEANQDAVEKYFENVSLEKQAKELKCVINHIFPAVQHVDIAGFSFGGRVAMATAATYPKLVRKLHITGVPAQRTPHAKLILESWLSNVKTIQEIKNQASQSYSNNSSSLDLIPFAWSSIMSTYSPTFLSQNEKRIPKWVQSISQQNTPEGILSLLEQTHTENISDSWHPISMANRIVSGHCVDEVQMAVGSSDCMSTVEETKKLGQLLDDTNEERKCEVIVYEGCGHAVMMEDGRTWRNDVIKFLDN